MPYVSVGDLALTFQNRRQNVQMKTDLSRLAGELASGKISNLSTAITGDLSPIVEIERSLTANLAYSTAAKEAAHFTLNMQTILGNVQDRSSKLGPTFLTASSAATPMLIQTATADAKEQFNAAVSSINTQIAGRYAFSGAATDSPPLADAGVILTALQGLVAAETTATGIQAAVDVWFDTPGGGFETIGYTGSSNPLAAFRVSESQSVSVDVTAANPEVRSVLKAFAMAALVGEGALAADHAERTALTRLTGELLMSGEYSLASVRTNIGSDEAEIDNAIGRNESEKLAMEIARTEISAIDPYRTATEIEAVKTQLETMYTLTVRLSRLSLAEYLR